MFSSSKEGSGVTSVAEEVDAPPLMLGLSSTGVAFIAKTHFKVERKSAA
jgi:hypothetical protein